MNLTTDKQSRKEIPIARGVLDYFPLAIAEVAHVSFVGNQQHNPGQKMHWARGKSSDHADCVARHLIERGTIDDDGLRHSAKMAWRSLALLQLELEKAEPATETKGWQDQMRDEGGSVIAETNDHIDLHQQIPPSGDDRQDLVALELLERGCPPAVAKQIVGGITFPPDHTRGNLRYGEWVYVAGPMRGKPKFNFYAFDSVRDSLISQGMIVISPADVDRNAGDGWKEGQTEGDTTPFVFRDFWSLFFIAKQKGSIYLMAGWPNSVGASAEFFLARWLGLKIITEGNWIDPLKEFVYTHD